jgi:hypothetical protein
MTTTLDDALSVRRAVVSLVVASCLAAWGESALAAPPGWRTHAARDGSLTLALPSSWLDTSQITPRLIAQRHLPQQIKNTLANMPSMPTLKLAAYDLAPGKVSKRFATNVNVNENVVPRGMSLQAIEATTMGQLQGSGALVGTVHASEVTVPAGQAYKLTAQLRLSGMVVAETQYGLLRGGIAAFITYSTTPAAAPAYAPTFTRSIQTFRFR